MTEKRFTYDSKTDSILKDGEFWLDGSVYTACNHSEICDELNALNDENEQLKHQLQQQEMEYATTCNRLAEENERLKQQLRIFSEGLKSEIRETKEIFEDYSECVDEKLELKKENEQLKQQIHYLKIVCRNELDEKTLKQVMGSLGDVE